MVENYRDVTVCGVPHRMTIADGCVIFSDKSGFYGVSRRLVFVYRSSLWYLQLDTAADTFGSVPAVHVVKMHKLLQERISPDHTEADGSEFELRFRD